MFRTRKSERSGPPVERLPPHAPEAEVGLCGCILSAPSECLDDLVEAGCRPEWCYDPRHQLILETSLTLHGQGRPWDLLVLVQALRDADALETAGGLAYVSGLPDQIPSPANASYYLDLVREKWQARSLIATCTEAAVEAFDAKEIAPLLSKTHARFLQLEEAAAPAVEIDIKTLLREKVVPRMEAHYVRGRAQIEGLTTGLEYLDKIYSGLGGDHGNYHVLAARPNVGKTSLATQIAMHAALDYRWLQEVSPEEAAAVETKEPRDVVHTQDGKCLVRRIGICVGISSLEMRADSLAQKMLFQRGEADLQRWRTGFARDADLVQLVKASAELGTSNRILIDDTPRLRIGTLKARWRRWHRQYGARLFILDYLQLMQSDTKRFRPDRVQELAEVSAELQALGKELNCPLIVLAQMNRDYEKDPSRAPRLSDLKDCGAVEQDADTVTFLYEPRLSDTQLAFFQEVMVRKFGDDWKKWDGRPQRINALVAKNRLGPKGKAELLLLHSSTRFVDWVVWLKGNNLKPAAAGESQYKQSEPEDPEDLL